MCSYLKFLLSSLVAGGANVFSYFELRVALFTYLERACCNRSGLSPVRLSAYVIVSFGVL